MSMSRATRRPVLRSKVRKSRSPGHKVNRGVKVNVSLAGPALGMFEVFAEQGRRFYGAAIFRTALLTNLHVTNISRKNSFNGK